MPHNEEVKARRLSREQFSGEACRFAKESKQITSLNTCPFYFIEGLVSPNQY